MCVCSSRWPPPWVIPIAKATCRNCERKCCEKDMAACLISASLTTTLDSRPHLDGFAPHARVLDGPGRQLAIANSSANLSLESHWYLTNVSHKSKKKWRNAAEEHMTLIDTKEQFLSFHGFHCFVSNVLSLRCFSTKRERNMLRWTGGPPKAVAPKTWNVFHWKTLGSPYNGLL